VTVILDEEKEPLTDRQRQVLDYIGRSIERRGYPPTLREIGEHMGIRSTNGVNDHLKALEKKGYLEREDLKSRALRPIDPANGGARSAASQRERFVDVPLLGKVAAGRPILALEQAEDTVRVDRFFLGRPGVGGDGREVFALRVVGDSMIEAGIFDGDFLFVRKQPDARRGEIVVAMIDGEATVKYYHPEPDAIVFKPANSAMRPIVVRRREWKSVNLLGIVIGVYRKLG
jgi:repressor LexA